MDTGFCSKYRDYEFEDSSGNFIENIRIKEYNEIHSEQFEMWRIRGFPFEKKWTFFHE